MEKTTIEWFIEQLMKNPLPQSKDEFMDGDLVDIINKAKEMEKKQILDACIHGFQVDAESNNWLGDSKQAKMYYNQTFKKD